MAKQNDKLETLKAEFKKANEDFVAEKTKLIEARKEYDYALIELNKKYNVVRDSAETAKRIYLAKKQELNNLTNGKAEK